AGTDPNGPQLCKGELIRYRTLTGICNDIKNPLMGSAGTVFSRNIQFEETFPLLGATQLIKNRHGDRISLMHPDPQVISRELLSRAQTDTSKCKGGTASGADAHCDYIPAPFFNVIAAYWIQFMTHDWFSHMDEGTNDKPMIETGCKSKLDGGKYRDLTPAEVAQLGCRPGDKMDAALIAQNEAPSTHQHGGH